MMERRSTEPVAAPLLSFATSPLPFRRRVALTLDLLSRGWPAHCAWFALSVLPAFFRTLRLMLLAIVTSSMPLIWAFICVMGIIYVFGVVFQQGATVHISTAGAHDAEVQSLKEYFASMPQTLLTLFMSVTGGVSWKECGRSSFNGSLVVWRTLCVLHFHNDACCAEHSITGIFVNDALELTRADNDLMLQTHVAQTTQHFLQLQKLFRDMDTDHSETLTLRELKDSSSCFVPVSCNSLSRFPAHLLVVWPVSGLCVCV